MSAWDMTGLATATLLGLMGWGCAASDDSAKYGVERDKTYRTLGGMLFIACFVWAAFCASRLYGAHL